MSNEIKADIANYQMPEDIAAARLSQICQAEREGRLAVLPVPVGSITYDKYNHKMEDIQPGIIYRQSNIEFNLDLDTFNHFLKTGIIRVDKNRYNKGNDCDACKNQYLCGEYGDAVGCHRQDNNLECEFAEAEAAQKGAKDNA